MSRETNITVLLAISAVLYGADAMAQVEEDEPLLQSEKNRREYERSKDVSPTTGKTAAEIINEARERVEGRSWAAPDWRESERRRKQEAEEEDQPLGWYGGLGGERWTVVPFNEVYRLQAAQRDSVPLQYLESVEEDETNDSSSLTIFFGRELNQWLDIEIGGTSLECFYLIDSYTPVIDETLPSDAQDLSADQWSTFDHHQLYLALLPRWRINDYVTIFSRFGVAYDESKLEGGLVSEGVISEKKECRTVNNQTVCETAKEYARTGWGKYQYRRAELIPIVGIGVTLFDWLRLETGFRFDAPIGEASTDVRVGLTFTARLKTSWPSRRCGSGAGPCGDL